MDRCIYFSWAALFSAMFAAPLLGQEVRYFEENGRTYRETSRMERRPVTTTQWEERRQTVYKEQYVTEMRDNYRTVYTPVTEYRMEPRWHNWWNPFSPPYVSYHMIPRRHWETRTERVQTPVTVREVVPETRITQVPKQVLGFEDREVKQRVALAPQTMQRPVIAGQDRRVAIAPAPRTLGPVGGIRQIENDPPRQGIVPQDLTGGSFRR